MPSPHWFYIYTVHLAAMHELLSVQNLHSDCPSRMHHQLIIPSRDVWLMSAHFEMLAPIRLVCTRVFFLPSCAVRFFYSTDNS